jgi:hypothetical protein
MDIWKAWLLESLPIHYIIPLLIVLSGTFFLGDYLHSIVEDSKEVVVEVIEEISHIDLLHSDDASEQPTDIKVAYTVDSDITRVMRI